MLWAAVKGRMPCSVKGLNPFLKPLSTLPEKQSMYSMFIELLNTEFNIVSSSSVDIPDTIAPALPLLLATLSFPAASSSASSQEASLKVEPSLIIGTETRSLSVDSGSHHLPLWQSCPPSGPSRLEPSTLARLPVLT